MKKLKVLTATLLACFAMGCGSASNNDQGASFTLFGFFSDSDGETGATGYALPLSDLANDEPSGIAENNLVTYLGLQNNLSGQFIRAQRAYYSYVIAGSDIQPPSTSSALSFVLGPVDNDVDSTLPDPLTGSDGQASTHYAGVPLVPSQIRAWISLHRGSLPEAPFDIEVTVYVRGITSAGDGLDTNPATIFVQATPDIVIPPSAGESDGEGDDSDTVEEGDASQDVDNSL
jgi:hypothetical protein